MRGDGGQGVELALEFARLAAGLGQLGAQVVEGLVTGAFAGGASDGVGDVGVPFSENVGGAVDGGVADAGFAGEVFLGQGSVGVLGLSGQEAGHGGAEFGFGGWGDGHLLVLCEGGGDGFDVVEAGLEGCSTGGWQAAVA
ncbi:hypothetical protein A6P39_000335 [Streptomyces sp. FXJ1.172]|uniref:hypothetical protein n=1 Tax=Streptomyces sp. FXJ1.172 TaxID=710705 RepID=UPI0007CFA077|nr:hypothetical protein [Streptomyces sp. FXJ1.172]WEO92700.1 hypothetical protein A6P39_000335 [Streptomyces sp. FXJ1.172]